VFHNVIVPLSGQTESLTILPHKLRKNIERKIGETYKGRVLSVISSVFSSPADDKKVTTTSGQTRKNKMRF
jgi:hypothetical protein